MIREFRLVLQEKTQQAAIDDTSSLAVRIMGLAKEEGQSGEWECTDDVVTKCKGGYESRMKFKYRGEQ